MSLKAIDLTTQVGWHKDGTALLAGHLLPEMYHQLRVSEEIGRAHV